MPQTPPKKIILDIQKCSFDESGIQDFWWPFHAEELRKFSSDVMRIYADILREFDPDDSIEFHPYRLISKYFIADLVGLFQADALFQRASTDEIDLVIPSGTRFWPLVQKGKTPDVNGVLGSIRRGPKKTNFLKKLLNVRRVLKILSKMSKHKSGGGLSLGDLKIAPITSKILKENIIATERTTLIARHARHSDVDVYFQRSDKWYNPVSKSEEEASFKKNKTDFEEKLLGHISDLYMQYGTKLFEDSYNYYATLISTGAALFRVHLDRLLAAPDKLPRHIWIGTGGQPWDMMLCLATKEYGGQSAGHDHATGSGHCAMPFISFVDLWGYDIFFTFNNTKSEGIKKITKSMPFLEKKSSEVSFVPIENTKKKIKQIKRNQEEIKKVFVMCPPYDRDRGRLSPIMPDAIRLDWQCRLLTFLRNEGYEAILKVHPESKVFPPTQLETVTGATISAEPFEKMMEEGDLVIFDHIYTSTFRATLETNMPITIIQAVDFYFSDEAEKKLRKRTGFVNGVYDDENRLHVNWSELSKEIKLSLTKNNEHEFAETHLLD